ncbi:MAG: hypothetical protein JWM41_4610 [Gemmatimonadetes bacterium]|nr:hypothetical protein [Gemmatimonadota bacterium]
MKLSRLRLSAVTLALLSAAACSDKAKSRAATDSALAKDLALAGQQTAQPTFQDTSIAPAPTQAARAKQDAPAPVRARTARQPKPAAPQRVAQTPVPAPVPAPAMHIPAAVAAPIHGEIGAGTGVALTSGSKVCTSTNLPGDKLVATVNETVTGSNGAVIPAGSTVVLEVASVTPGQNADAAHIAFRVRSVVVNDKTYNVAADVAPTTPLEKTKVAGSDPNADKKKVIGGAIAGALIGQMIGHNTKGTVIGAAAGAAAGVAASKAGEKWEGCLPSGAALRLTFNSGLVMS